jgi:hypothetical protein
MKIFQSSVACLFSLFISVNSWASPCGENLKTFIEQLPANSTNDPIPFSIALLSTAQCENSSHYEKIRAQFIQQLPKGLIDGHVVFDEKNQKDSLDGQSQPEQNDNFNLWLLGRLVFADSIKKYPEQNKIAALLQNYLSKYHIDQSQGIELGDDSAMYLWGYAYAVAANPELYMNNMNMLLSTEDLKMKTRILFQNPNLSESNKGWIVALDILAAANAHNPSLYDFSKNLILKENVITKILLSDYRPWAWGIVRQAAFKMQDTTLFTRATQEYEQSLRAIQKTPANTEKIQQMILLISTSTFDYTKPIQPAENILPSGTQ